jgi:hypothetical protein
LKNGNLPGLGNTVRTLLATCHPCTYSVSRILAVIASIPAIRHCGGWGFRFAEIHPYITRAHTETDLSKKTAGNRLISSIIE